MAIVETAHDSVTTINNGAVFVHGQKGLAAARSTNSNLTIDPSITNANSIADLNVIYDHKFDEPRYYTGDSATDS
jgi:hypothetical protein